MIQLCTTVSTKTKKGRTAKGKFPSQAHWVYQSFTKMSAVLCVREIEGSHTGSAICAKFESMLVYT